MYSAGEATWENTSLSTLFSGAVNTATLIQWSPATEVQNYCSEKLNTSRLLPRNHFSFPPAVSEQAARARTAPPPCPPGICLHLAARTRCFSFPAFCRPWSPPMEGKSKALDRSVETAACAAAALFWARRCQHSLGPGQLPSSVTEHFVFSCLPTALWE